MSETEWNSIAERAAEEARYILQTGCTVRACAEQFGTSKSTVHKDVTERLRRENAQLWAAVRKVLGVNLKERHLRGGAATRRKYSVRRAAQKRPPKPRPAEQGKAAAR